MDIIRSAIERLETWIEGSGSEEGVVKIDIDPDRIVCQYEKGACLKAVYGGISSEFVTMDPLTATTRIGYMFGAKLEKAKQRAAACAILNVVAGFFCISRILKSCSPKDHHECLSALLCELGVAPVYLVGMVPAVKEKFSNVVTDPDDAEIILVVGDGLIHPEIGDLVEKYRKEKRVLLIAPSSAGVSALLGCEHWCPYGRAK